jgi:uncharacterized protein (TIGR02466 family)
MLSFSRNDVFPTPIWQIEMENAPVFNQNLLTVIETERAQDSKGVQASNVLGWHSQDNLHKNEKIQRLLGVISQSILAIVNELEWDLDQIKPVINHCWAMVMPKYAFSSLHHHPNAVLSGVYYVKVPEHSGDLYFHDPRAGSQILLPPLRKQTVWTLGKVRFKPKEGMLVIFPSWFWHGVEPNLSEECRISISFNIGVSKANLSLVSQGNDR